MRAFIAGATLLLLGFTSAGWANGIGMYVPPAKVAEITTPVRVANKALKDEKPSVAAKIVIPIHLLRKELERIDKEKGAANTEAAPAQPAPKQQLQQSRPQSSAGPAFGTIFAGIAMSLAAVSVVFVVRRPKAQRAAAVLIVVAAASAAASYSFANAPPPNRPGPNAPPAAVRLPADEGGKEVVVIQLTDGGFPRTEGVTIYLRD